MFAPGLLAEHYHVLKPAGHRGVEGSRPVETAKPAEEGVADKPDQQDEGRD
ncbi:MAG: hypothetical protein ACJASC_003507 [Limimaricola cinnabarinus]|jgi:hypothetical protein